MPERTFRYKIIKKGRTTELIVPYEDAVCQGCGRKLLNDYAFFINLNKNKSYCSECFRKIEGKIKTWIKLNGEFYQMHGPFLVVSSKKYEEEEGIENLIEFVQGNQAIRKVIRQEINSMEV